MGQDFRTGEMHEIDHDTFKDLRRQLDVANLENKLNWRLPKLPTAKLVTPAGNLVELRGALCEGEEVEVRGCHFRIVEIGRRFVILEGVPQIEDVAAVVGK